MIRLYNTLTRQVDELKTIEKGKVRLYACGLTVYSEPHIGNWSTYVYWDVLVRLLNREYDLRHVQNITDVGHLTDDQDAGDDKLAEAAKRERLTAWEIADKYIASAEKGRRLLNITEPTDNPRATECIDEQIAVVKQLEDKGFTYEIEGDGIYYDTSKFPSYADFARLDVEGLKSGQRVEDVGKKQPTDFALWKFSKQGEKRDMEWDSPWGKGFPGWHLECSVLAQQALGDQIDIHTGGVDHINIHHTNEIAQSEAATGKSPFSAFWLHANHILADGKKMSKSLGNIYTLADLEDKGYDTIAFRLLVLESHYRTSSNFTWKLLDTSAARLKRWQAVADQRWQTNDGDKITFQAYEKAIVDKLSDDLDTPGAISSIEEAFSKVEQHGLSETSKQSFESLLQTIDDLLGINLLKDDVDSSIKDLVVKRQAAKDAKNFDESDKLRDELTKKGVAINDTPNGPKWFRL